MMLYVLKKQETSFMQALALAQVQIDEKAGVSRFEEYRKKAFPWAEAAKKKQDEAHLKRLEEAVRNGPLVVSAVHAPRASSRLVKRAERPLGSADRKRMNDLYTKLGKTVPL